MENKNKENENRIILGDFNCTMGKMDKDGENKTQKLYRLGASGFMEKGEPRFP